MDGGAWWATVLLLLLLLCRFSRVQLFATQWTVAHQALPSMGFSRQEYWSGLPFPSPGDLPDPGIEPKSPALQVEFFTTEPPGKVKVKLLSRVRIFARLLHPWDSPGKNTGVGCHFLLQGIFLTQGSNPSFPHCRQTL